MSADEHPRIQISPDLLLELGFDALTRSQVTDILEELYSTLEVRVGNRIAEGLNSNQLTQFENIVARRNESEALAWLQSNSPAYKQVVDTEWESIIRTLRRASDLKRTQTESVGTGEREDDNRG